MMAYGTKADWESAMNSKEGRYFAARERLEYMKTGYMAGFIAREELEAALDQLNEAREDMDKAVRPLPQD